MTPASNIEFPFERGIEYPIATLVAFEAGLHRARQSNCDLGNELRAPETGSPRWIKLRNEELVPLEHYVRHKRVPDTAKFMIMPEGCKTDIQLSNSGRTENLQITVADPSWNFPEPNSIKHGGHHRRIEMEILNTTGSAGSGPIISVGDTKELIRRPISGKELVDAYHAGLVEALSKKFQKKYEDREYVLLVHARAFCENLSIDRFLDVALSGLSEARTKARNSCLFKSVYIFDREEHFFTEVSS